MTPPGLPDKLVAVTSQWLESVEQALERIGVTGRASGTAAGGVVAAATDDALVATKHFRRVLAGEIPMTDRSSTPWTKVNEIPQQLAEQIHRDVAAATAIPEDLLETVREELSPDRARVYLLLIGDVAGCSISTVASTLWDSHARFAPTGWHADPPGSRD